jgi:hypothetical protein
MSSQEGSQNATAINESTLMEGSRKEANVAPRLRGIVDAAETPPESHFVSS